MPSRWDDEPAALTIARDPDKRTDAEQIAFERAAIDAAVMCLETMRDLDAAYQRIAKMEKQLSALLGLERNG